jgi:hypothetical protein
VKRRPESRFTPGPERWKLSMLDRSSTTIVYAPGARCETAAPDASTSDTDVSETTVARRTSTPA